MVEALKAQFPKLSDSERDFPSNCFALARSLTIYDKLIRDFAPNTPKYVIKGIAEFAVTAPEVVTGDNYEQCGAKSLLGGIEINTEARGGKTPRIKRSSEYLGQCYFDYLVDRFELRP